MTALEGNTVALETPQPAHYSMGANGQTPERETAAPRNPHSGRGVRLTAESKRGSNPETAELAEFLRNSGPIEPADSRTSPFSLGSSYRRGMKLLRSSKSKTDLVSSGTALPTSVLPMTTSKGKPYMQISVDYETPPDQGTTSSPPKSPRSGSPLLRTTLDEYRDKPLPTESESSILGTFENASSIRESRNSLTYAPYPWGSMGSSTTEEEATLDRTTELRSRRSRPVVDDENLCSLSIAAVGGASLRGRHTIPDVQVSDSNTSIVSRSSVSTFSSDGSLSPSNLTQQTHKLPGTSGEHGAKAGHGSPPIPIPNRTHRPSTQSSGGTSLAPARALPFRQGDSPAGPGSMLLNESITNAELEEKKRRRAQTVRARKARDILLHSQTSRAQRRPTPDNVPEAVIADHLRELCVYRSPSELPPALSPSSVQTAFQPDKGERPMSTASTPLMSPSGVPRTPNAHHTLPLSTPASFQTPNLVKEIELEARLSALERKNRVLESTVMALIRRTIPEKGKWGREQQHEGLESALLQLDGVTPRRRSL